MQKNLYNQGFSLLIHSKNSRLLPANSHTQRFGLTVSFRRFPSSFYESYRMGGTSPSTSLMPQQVQAVIPPQRDAFVGLKRFGEPFEDYLRFTNKLTHST